MCNVTFQRRKMNGSKYGMVWYEIQQHRDEWANNKTWGRCGSLAARCFTVHLLNNREQLEYRRFYVTQNNGLKDRDLNGNGTIGAAHFTATDSVCSDPVSLKPLAFMQLYFWCFLSGIHMRWLMLALKFISGKRVQQRLRAEERNHAASLCRGANISSTLLGMELHN